MAAPDNYLELEPIIIERWKTQMPELVNVVAIADLPDIMQVSQSVPAGIVYYDGDNIGTNTDRGASQGVDQRWALVVAVRNVRDVREGSAARQEAGPLISKTLNVIAGWKPKEGYKEFRRISGPGPAYTKGFAYFPLLFSTRLFT
jgi:hypothetical protein